MCYFGAGFDWLLLCVRLAQCCSGSGSCDKDCKKDCCKGGKKECCKGDKKKECCKGKAETCPVPYPYITTAAVVAVVAVAAYAFYKRR